MKRVMVYAASSDRIRTIRDGSARRSRIGLLPLLVSVLVLSGCGQGAVGSDVTGPGESILFEEAFDDDRDLPFVLLSEESITLKAEDRRYLALIDDPDAPHAIRHQLSRRVGGVSFLSELWQALARSRSQLPDIRQVCPQFRRLG